MPRTGKPARAFVAAMLLVLTLLTSSPALAPASAATLRTKMLREINEIRERRDVRTVKLTKRLSRKATRHTRSMIRKNRLVHTKNLDGYMARRGYSPWGENIGCADTVNRLMRRLMHSRSHRKTIIAGKFRRVGLGVVTARRRNICGRRAVWTTQIFYAG